MSEPPVPPSGFRTFIQVLVNTAIANVTTSFVWFALTFWIYAETRNVIATLVIGVTALAPTTIHLAARGLGSNPIRTMLLTIREWGWLFIVGIWLIMALMPVVEAAGQTVIQAAVPYEKQGRVFGFASTFEAATAPVTEIVHFSLAQGRFHPPGVLESALGE